MDDHFCILLVLLLPNKKKYFWSHLSWFWWVILIGIMAIVMDIYNYGSFIQI